MIPGWPYSVVAGLETGRSSWTALLDAVRLGPDHDPTAVTAAQVRDGGSARRVLGVPTGRNAALHPLAQTPGHRHRADHAAAADRDAVPD